jgi:hypothetical protein
MNSTIPQKRLSQKILMSITIAFGFAVVFWCIYLTLFKGTTKGPDLMVRLFRHEISIDSIQSVEIVHPKIGGSPFSENEYANLQRKNIITDPEIIAQLLSYLKTAQTERPTWNHPGTFEQCHIKINSEAGYFWLEIYLLRDRTQSRLVLEANNLNATNPNGAKTYYIKEYEALLDILKSSALKDPS